jgi:hypothetical protein
MEIKPTYVTFEQQHKFLEKGCDVETIETKYGYELLQQWQVVEWLRVNHGIWVVVNIGIPHGRSDMYYSNVIKFGTKNRHTGNREHKSKFKSEFSDSPQEAYSAAFDYVLKELI